MTSLPRLLVVLTLLVAAGCAEQERPGDREKRTEVVFWHFWGGRDRPVVDRVIERFNASQDRYRVRGVAMPGANLELKFLLSVAGGDPPDLLNHDDVPLVAEWAHRGALTPLDEIAPEQEVSAVSEWLFPAARSLASFQGRLYALPNGLDIRALYYNQTLLDELGLDPPETIEELDGLSNRVAPPNAAALRRVGYLPDPRRLWAWGIVFGGQFAHLSAEELSERVTVDSPEVLAALEWMAGYSERYGPDRVATFRSGDQALTGATFPLLADRRYAAIMDGQWRVRDLAEAALAAGSQGESGDLYGVVPLPRPPGGRERAGWVNGNLFVIPRGANSAAGAWEFMKFWVGFDPEQDSVAGVASETCATGGWVPVSQQVVDRPEFQRFLGQQPLFRVFVELASSPNQHPTPAMPGAAYYYREVIAAAEDVMYRGANPEERLALCARRVRERCEALRETP